MGQTARNLLIDNGIFGRSFMANITCENFLNVPQVQRVEIGGPVLLHLLAMEMEGNARDFGKHCRLP